jgi:uncharacterized protein (DUF2141 family)
LTPIDYNISITGDCSGNGTGIIEFNISGGSAPYNVNLTSPTIGTYATFGNLIISGLTEGSYIGNITDSSIPPLFVEFNLVVSDGLCISFEQSEIDNTVSIQDTTCGLDNGSATVFTTSNYSSIIYYLYDFEDNFINSAITNTFTYTFLNLSAGTYYIVAEDPGGCNASTPTFIIQTSPELSFGLYVIQNAACGDIPIGKILITGLTGNPPFTYQWTNGSIESSITGLTAGNYGVTVTDGYGCQKTVNATLEDFPPVGLGIITATPPTCFSNDGAISVTVTGGTVPYYFSASTGDQGITYSQTYTLSGLSPGEYSFLVTDAAFCTFTTSTNLVSPGGIESVSVSVVNSSCSSSDGSVTVILVGGTQPYTYTLIYPNGDVVANTNSLLTYSFNNLESGTYTVAVEDATGCGYTEEVYIIAIDKFTIQAFVTGTTCNLNNGMVEVIATTGFTTPLTYSIDGEQTIITSSTAVTFTSLSSGMHTVTVTDAFGCVQTKQIPISNSVSLLFSLYAVQCNGGNNGSITALITSGKPPYAFDWTDNVPGNPQQAEITGLGNGTYGVTIVDSDGCSQYQETNIICNNTYTSGTSGILFQTYIMGQGIFELDSLSKCGLLQMLNEGYQDLIEGDENCQLVSATFEAKVSVNPLGFYVTEEFFMTDSLVIAPTDDLWYNTIKELLLTVPGVGNVLIDPIRNSITIETIPNDLTLNNQQIIVELIINYDVNCSL